MLVAVQLSVFGLYLPPELKSSDAPLPPQMIISVPVQTAVCKPRASGALTVFVAVQLSAMGLYLPPLLKLLPLFPPQTIISLPVQIDCDKLLAGGAPEAVVAYQTCVELKEPGLAVA